ncbi:hypothetical protein EMIT043CA1_70292 [Pseudomonas brassicacearum]
MRRLVPRRTHADYRALAPIARAHAVHRSSVAGRRTLRPPAGPRCLAAPVPARQHAQLHPSAKRRALALRVPGTVLKFRMTACGSELARDAVCQSITLLADLTLWRASSLPQVEQPTGCPPIHQQYGKLPPIAVWSFLCAQS